MHDQAIDLPWSRLWTLVDLTLTLTNFFVSQFEINCSRYDFK